MKVTHFRLPASLRWYTV